MGTKTIKVLKKVERKTFVKGYFVGKYYGDFDNKKTFFNSAKYYDIHIYEGEINNVEIIQSGDRHGQKHHSFYWINKVITSHT